jgi:hypothetical protein
MTRNVENPPCSIFGPGEPLAFEKMIARGLNDRIDNAFDYYQEKEIISKTFIHKPLRSNGL